MNLKVRYFRKWNLAVFTICFKKLSVYILFQNTLAVFGSQCHSTSFQCPDFTPALQRKPDYFFESTFRVFILSFWLPVLLHFRPSYRLVITTPCMSDLSKNQYNEVFYFDTLKHRPQNTQPLR